MGGITLGVGVAYETTKVNLSNINKALDSIRAGAPEGIKDLISAPSYYEVSVVFGGSIVSTGDGQLASRAYDGRSFEDMSLFEGWGYLQANSVGVPGALAAGGGITDVTVEPFAAISIGAGAGVGAHGGVDFEAFVSVGHFNDLAGFSLAGEAQVLPHAIQGGGLAVPIGSYPGAPGTKAYVMRSAEKILQPNGALEFEYAIIVSGAQATTLAREIVNGDVRIDEIADYLSQQANNHCFKADTPIQMWPLDSSIKPRIDGAYDEQLVLSKVWEKPICEICVGDLVVSYDDKGRIKPGPVTRTMTNRATHLLDFWNTGVTPGHAYYCADGKFKDQHVPLMDILRTDGAIMRADGTMIRAATNCEVGSMGDMMINASATLQKPDGTWTEPKPGKVRFGTRTILPDGRHMSFMEMAASEGWKVSSGDGYMIGMVKDENGTLREQKFLFPYTHGEELPKPEDYILARSDVTLEAIYAAGEWEQIGTRMPAPSEMVGLNTNYPGTLLQPSKPEPNIPPAFADHPDAPNCTMSETVFK